MEAKQATKKSFVGTVVSDKMEKTVVVSVDSKKMDPKYKKFVRSRKKYKAHDEQNQCGEGDVVRIVETRPLSRDKRWNVIEIIEKAK